MSRQPNAADFDRAFNDFIVAIYDAVGLYVDSCSAFEELYRTLLRIQQNMAIQNNKTIDQLDNTLLNFSNKHPADKASRIMHRVTQGEQKRRLQRGGRNYDLAVQRFFVDVYDVWEYAFRKPLAFAIGLSKKDDLKLDLMADFALIRHAVLKNHGVAFQTSINVKLFAGLRRVMSSLIRQNSLRIYWIRYRLGFKNCGP